VAKKQVLKKENGTTTKPEANPSGGMVDFANETKQELGKVVWPSRQQLLSESVAVILMVILVATVIYLVDNIFGWIAGKVF
jgi:preprotein translocase subunit SecE